MQKQGFFARLINAIGMFFLVVVKSSYDMEWYRLVRVRSWTAALRYAMAFTLALMVFATAAITPGLFSLQAGFIAHVSTRFPNDARLEVKDGRLTTNLEEPFEAGIEGFRVVIDTSVQGTSVFPEVFGKTEGVLVGKDAIFMQKDKNERRTYLMTDFSDIAVTKLEVMEWVRTWGALLILISLVIFAAAFWTLSLVSTALYVAIASAIASALARLWGVRLAYKTWFAVGLHAVTLPILVNLAMTAMGVRIPLAYTFIYFMFVAAVIADERNQPTTKPATPLEAPRERSGADAPPAGPPAVQDPPHEPPSGAGPAAPLAAPKERSVPPKTRKIAKRRPPANKPPSE